MPTNVNEDDHLHHHHHHHHHGIFNPDLNSNPSPSIPTTNEYPPPPKANTKYLSLLLKAIIMVLIISLFFLFLGIAAVAVLHLLLPRGAFHRQRHRRPAATNTQFPVDSSGTAYSAEDLQMFLPRLKYAAGLPGMEGKDCAVCLECFKEGELCRSLPDCDHMFHASCVDKWLTKVANCPICRARVRLNSRATGSVIGDDDCKLLWAVGL